MRNVAEKVGVSHQTVSRVISNSARVLPKTRAKVEAAIQKFGYHPNAIARSMVQGWTYTLACISPNLIDFTFTSILDAAEAEARKQCATPA